MLYSANFSGTLERSGNALRELGYVAYGPQTFFMLKNQENEESLNLRYLKQRTEKWFLAREDGAMSSSEIGAALNFYGLEKAKAIQEKIWKKVNNTNNLTCRWYLQRKFASKNF